MNIIDKNISDNSFIVLSKNLRSCQNFVKRVKQIGTVVLISAIQTFI